MADNYATNFRDILKQNTVENEFDPKLTNVNIGSNIGKAFDNVNTAVKQSGIHALDNVMSQYTTAEELGKAYADGSLNKAFGSFNKLDSAAIDALVKAKQKQLFNATEQAKTDEITSRTNTEKLNQSKESIGVKQLNNALAKYANIDQFNQAIANGEITNVDGVSQATFANIINAKSNALKKAYTENSIFDANKKRNEYILQTETLTNQAKDAAQQADFASDPEKFNKFLSNLYKNVPDEYAKAGKEAALERFNTLRKITGKNKEVYTSVNNTLDANIASVNQDYEVAKQQLAKNYNINPNMVAVNDLTNDEVKSELDNYKTILGIGKDKSIISSSNFKLLMNRYKEFKKVGTVSNREMLGLLKTFSDDFGRDNIDVKNAIEKLDFSTKLDQGNFLTYMSKLKELDKARNQAITGINAKKVSSATKAKRIALENSSNNGDKTIDPNNYDVSNFMSIFRNAYNDSVNGETDTVKLASANKNIEQLNKTIAAQKAKLDFFTKTIGEERRKELESQNKRKKAINKSFSSVLLENRRSKL